MLHDAYEIAGDPRAGPFLFTCAHGTRRLPEWQPEAADLPFVEDHWGWDVDAAERRAAGAEVRLCSIHSFPPVYHGRAHRVVYLELEVRNDLIDTRERVCATAPRIARAPAAYAPADTQQPS